MVGDPINSERKVRHALQSLARYVEFREFNAPEFMIEQELIILTSRLNDLNFQEMQTVQQAWPNFSEERKRESEIGATLIEEKLEREIFTLN